ncbi:phasin family protein [Bradyrhizobium sp.]|jgi:hypothetical protein|uniref:phasin family protein n=1 Tax=Bradyrhizobium sp. TaxID=376 RepID=UPI002C75F8BF|nr:phasin family protein [Bradyrhizobium sp.]HMM87626.1 phasin family protein [Bradyrhizobium sp.]
MIGRTSEMGRLCLDSASSVARAVADHNLKNMRLSSDNALRSLEYVTQLADAKTGLEVIALSGAHCQNQLNVLGGYTDNLVDLIRKMPKDAAEPFRMEAIVAGCVIL